MEQKKVQGTVKRALAIEGLPKLSSEPAATSSAMVVIKEPGETASA